MPIPEIKTPILASEGLSTLGIIKKQKELKEGLKAFGKIIKDQKKIETTPVLSKFVKDFGLDKLNDFLKSLRKIYDENVIKKKETAMITTILLLSQAKRHYQNFSQVDMFSQKCLQLVNFFVKNYNMCRCFPSFTFSRDFPALVYMLIRFVYISFAICHHSS